VRITPGQCDIQDVRTGDYLDDGTGAYRRVTRAGWMQEAEGSAYWYAQTDDETVWTFGTPTARVTVLIAS
jgi:hypothetical protein